jgi:hypothetical protein
MKPDKPNSSFAPLAIGFVIGAVTVGALVLMWLHDNPSPSHSHPPPLMSGTSTSPAAAPAFDVAVSRVASRFVCSCGTCGEKRLDVCSCETAQTERAFIQEQLRNGRSEAEAAEALKQKHGGLRSA